MYFFIPYVTIPVVQVAPATQELTPATRLRQLVNCLEFYITQRNTARTHQAYEEACQALVRIRALLDVALQFDPLPDLPVGVGLWKTMETHIYIRREEQPGFNFIGRLLGPNGQTLHELQAVCGCTVKIFRYDDQLRRWSCFGVRDDVSASVDIRIKCTDYENRANIKIQHAVQQIDKFLVPIPDGFDCIREQQFRRQTENTADVVRGADASAHR